MQVNCSITHALNESVTDEARQDHYKWELLDKPVIRAASSFLGSV